MIFVETNIFQYTLLYISSICNNFHNYYANNWINCTIFHTSPFILGNVHYSIGLNLINFLDKNKKTIKKFDNSFSQNIYKMKEYENIK